MRATSKRVKGMEAETVPTLMVKGSVPENTTTKILRPGDQVKCGQHNCDVADVSVQRIRTTHFACLGVWVV